MRPELPEPAQGAGIPKRCIGLRPGVFTLGVARARDPRPPDRPYRPNGGRPNFAA